MTTKLTSQIDTLEGYAPRGTIVGTLLVKFFRDLDHQLEENNAIVAKQTLTLVMLGEVVNRLEHRVKALEIAAQRE